MNTNHARYAALLLAGLVLAGCSTTTASDSTQSSQTPVTASSAASVPASSPVPTESTGSSAPAGAPTVTISNFAFTVPPSVPAGAQVQVMNSDPVEHTLTIKGVGLDVKVPASGSASFTAPAAGTYELTCDFHPNMKGSLVVS